MAKELLIQESLQNPDTFRAFSKDDVFKAFSDLGYGPSKMLVNSFYLRTSDNLSGVGVLTITPEHCSDHFGVFRGIEQIEAVAQAAILVAKFSDRIPRGKRPLLREVEGFQFDFPIVEGAVINLMVQLNESDGSSFNALGQVVVGETIVSQGSFKGGIADERAVNILVRRRHAMQKRSEPLFPPLP